MVVVVDEGRKITRRGGCDKKSLKGTEMWVIEELDCLPIRGLALVEGDWDAAGLAPSLSLLTRACLLQPLRKQEA